MKLTLEQFETQWTENNLSVTDWFDTTYGLFKELEELQSRSCDTCKYQADSNEGMWCIVLDLEIISPSFCCNRYKEKEQ